MITLSSLYTLVSIMLERTQSVARYMNPTNINFRAEAVCFFHISRGIIQTPPNRQRKRIGFSIAQCASPVHILCTKSSIECGVSKKTPGLSLKIWLKATRENIQRNVWTAKCIKMRWFSRKKVRAFCLGFRSRKTPAMVIKQADSRFRQAMRKHG